MGLIYTEPRREKKKGFYQDLFLEKRQMKLKVFGGLLYRLTFSTVMLRNEQSQNSVA